MNYIEILKKKNLHGPLSFVDLQRFDENAKTMAKAFEKTNLKIRIATKSLRVPELIKRVLNSSSVYQGLMCYSAQEALFLSGFGLDDFLIAYPTLNPEDLTALKELQKQSRKFSLVVDDVRQIQALTGFVTPISLILEYDLSLRWGSLVIGVRRSPLRQPQQVLKLIQEIKKHPQIRFQGIMAYEAHVAGVGDKNPFKKALNPLLKILRQWSAKKVALKRRELLKAMRSELPEDFIFNGGGTGSLSFNVGENQVLTEVTAGSGFYCPLLFDYYSNFKLQPSAFFALQVVRQPEDHWYTCLGGGYVASGEPGWDRVPQVYDDRQAVELSSFEATGEVQTPVQLKSGVLQLGQNLVFRHAKAGELMERFNEVILIDSETTDFKVVKTYRGYGQCFF